MRGWASAGRGLHLTAFSDVERSWVRLDDQVPFLLSERLRELGSKDRKRSADARSRREGHNYHGRETRVWQRWTLARAGGPGRIGEQGTSQFANLVDKQDVGRAPRAAIGDIAPSTRDANDAG